MCEMVNVETHVCSLPWTSATETSSRVKTVKAYTEEPGFAMTASEIHGWMDGWMDGWILPQESRRSNSETKVKAAITFKSLEHAKHAWWVGW
jgi:hypothetical protein